jgi:hypothetical protein
MWVITKDGFFSAVLYRDTGKDLPTRVTRQVKPEDVLVVRTRSREDAQAYVAYLQAWITDESLRPNDADIIETPMADYQFRVFSTRSEWASFLTATALDIDYKNFKSAIDDSHRHDIYMSVWGVLRRIGSKWRSDRRGFSWEEPELPFEYVNQGGGKYVQVRGYTRRKPKKADA